ncbi:MAG: hypothetical protein ACE141_06925 [Bryobacteraceae bacterium]
MTGTIVGLAASSRTGTIRSQDGARLSFSAAGVLGDFDALAVGHPVSFELERAPSRNTAVRVFREPLGTGGPAKKPDGSVDLRYVGFEQAGSIRSYRFDALASGHVVQQFVVNVDLTLMRKYCIGVQEAPALCLRKLAADLRTVPGAGPHELDSNDLVSYASSRAAAAERRKPRHSMIGRRGPPPPGPVSRTRAS